MKPVQHLDEQQRGAGDRLANLQKREADLRAKITAEQERLRKREAMDRRRLAEIIGGVLITEIPPELKSSIKAILTTAFLDDRARRFLQERGW